MKTQNLFIYNENYPLNSEMYNKYSEKLSKCNKDEKCVSWVKFDIESELKDYALKVGVKLDGSEESNFSGEEMKAQVSVLGEKAKALPAVVSIVLVILLILAVHKKSWVMGGSAVALGVLLLLKPEILGNEMKKV
jgi:hypothetical protein